MRAAARDRQAFTTYLTQSTETVFQKSLKRLRKSKVAARGLSNSYCPGEALGDRQAMFSSTTPTRSVNEGEVDRRPRSHFGLVWGRQLLPLALPPGADRLSQPPFAVHTFAKQSSCRCASPIRPLIS